MGQKACFQCKTLYPLDHFKKVRGVGYRLRCTACQSKVVARSNQFYKDNPGRKLAYRKPALHKQRLRGHGQGYSLTEEEFNNLRAEAGGRCLICDTEQKLVIDHCHSSGIVRGLICDLCNKGLGFFKDNVSSLANAIEYLKTRG